MKKILIIVALVMCSLIGLVNTDFFQNDVADWINYHFLFTPAHRERYKVLFKRAESIIIRNDTNDEVFAEFTKDGQVTNDYYEADSAIFDTQGKVRVFVPEKKDFYPKGWYTIEYPYPYPLTKQTSWFAVGPRAVRVKLTDIVHSLGLAAGLISYADPIPVKFGRGRGGERALVQDIKVTYEPGEAPKKEKEQ